MERTTKHDPRMIELLRQGGLRRIELSFKARNLAVSFVAKLNRIRTLMAYERHVYWPLAERAIIRRPRACQNLVDDPGGNPPSMRTSWTVVIEPSDVEFDEALTQAGILLECPIVDIPAPPEYPADPPGSFEEMINEFYEVHKPSEEPPEEPPDAKT